MPSLLYRTRFGRSLNFVFINNVTSTHLINYCTKNSTEDKGKALNTKEESKTNSEKSKKPALKPPEEPTACCMTGCSNCVWLEYAEELCEYYKDGGEQAIKEINERISDPNIKAYILHELRMRNKK